jgi:hypothetical protein
MGRVSDSAEALVRIATPGFREKLAAYAIESRLMRPEPVLVCSAPVPARAGRATPLPHKVGVLRYPSCGAKKYRAG